MIKALRDRIESPNCKFAVHEPFCTDAQLAVIPEGDELSNFFWGGDKEENVVCFMFRIDGDLLRVELHYGIGYMFESDGLLAPPPCHDPSLNFFEIIKRESSEKKKSKNRIYGLGTPFYAYNNSGENPFWTDKNPTWKKEEQSIEIAAYCDEEILKNKDGLSRVVDSAWEKMDAFRSQMRVCIACYNFREEESQMNLEDNLAQGSALFCFTGSSSLKSIEPYEEPQDVNHNQEVLFALLNEALGNSRPIFKSRELNEEISKIARQELQKYRLYGMVLWDQDRDSDIEKIIARRYCSLQEAAAADDPDGGYFKLMALFSRAPKVYDSPWKNAFTNVSKKIVDDTVYSNIFLHALGVSGQEQNVPYLVVTESLNADRILLVPLKEKLIEIVGCLGEIANGGCINLELCQNALRHQFGQQSEIRSLNDRSFAQRLLAPLTEIMLNPHTGIRAQMESPEVLLKNIKTAEFARYRAIKTALEVFDEEDRNSLEYTSKLLKLEDLAMDIVYRSSLQAKEIDSYANCGFAERLLEQLENSISRKCFKSAVKCLANLDFFEDDYSPITIAFGKVFENEINHSIVQLVRKVLDIPMPDYYCKLYPEMNGKFIIGTTNFNKGSRRGDWLPPECGSTHYVLRNDGRYWDEILTNIPFVLGFNTSLTYGDLCENWGTICWCRNAAAHPGEEGFSRENMEKMVKAFQKLDSLQCFHVLKNLRVCMRTNLFENRKSYPTEIELA